ncbi:MAG TPA: class I SAM-dependent rRNA methyltransferase [Armatimonadota bacterium]|jgi:23S rRNA (cytosine1962-C5)-methyltransferase
MTTIPTANPTAKINARAVQRLQQGHLWIYASDVINVRDAEPGDVVAMHDERGYPQGYAFFSASSQITLRWCAPVGDPPDKEFWRARLQQADAYRWQVVEDTDAYRMVYSEGDLLSSLIIDRYGDHLVLQTLSQGTDRLKDTWVALLQELYSPASIIERNDASVRKHEQLPTQSGVLFGSVPDEVEIRLNGVAFGLDLLGGQKTGAFLDQRENYAAAARYAHGRALDAFTFAGGFALHLAPNTESVLAVDISEDATALARRNAARNEFGNVELVTANVFDLLRDLEKDGERFDTIVLDPPAFTKGKATVEGAYRGYKEINLRALRLLNPGGTLVTCSCSFHMSEEHFVEMLTDASGDARRPLRLVEKRLQARDHPILLSLPETKYLKCLIAEVV